MRITTALVGSRTDSGCSFPEQSRCGRLGARRGERCDAPDVFTADSEPLTAGGEDSRCGAAGQDALHRLGDAVDDVFGVVEHDQQVESTHVGQQRRRRSSVRSQAQRGDHDIGDGRRTLDRCELDHARTEIEAISRSAGDLDCETGLADTTRAGQRDEAGALEQLDDELGVVVAPNER